ncbi:uncharacterized protein MEPE_05279 [Melanopsichium pennsylvanicum]|uniref:Uncharacterized protein n=1 Tax=Melanopsichium pennsylvanicum TaxID=63383 RepID=A0AAJ4XPT8_9BASI|nr:uncharacterized protein MEPE_05279 [Melanopsichium pennsylvanicum]
MQKRGLTVLGEELAEMIIEAARKYEKKCSPILEDVHDIVDILDNERQNLSDSVSLEEDLRWYLGFKDQIKV